MLMKQTVFILTLIFFISCNDGDEFETNSLLKGAPYGTLTDSIQQQPENANLYYKRGGLLLENEQYNYAEKDFKKAWNLRPAEEYALGIANLLRRKNTDSAILFIEEAIQKLPLSIALQISLAR